MKKQYTKPCAELIDFEIKTAIMDNIDLGDDDFVFTESVPDEW